MQLEFLETAFPDKMYGGYKDQIDIALPKFGIDPHVVIGMPKLSCIPKGIYTVQSEQNATLGKYLLVKGCGVTFVIKTLVPHRNKRQLYKAFYTHDLINMEVKRPPIALPVDKVRKSKYPILFLIPREEPAVHDGKPSCAKPMKDYGSFD